MPSLSSPSGSAELPPACELEAFRARVWAYFRENRREMPWRDVDDAYAVLVSEVMLQQTQAARVEPRYLEWMAALPTVDALAAAPLPLVLELWQGLGYNRRAIALKRAAEAIVERSGGTVPSDPQELRRLPGVGPTTAAAVANYAFRLPTPFIETNVRAAVLHAFFGDADDVPDSMLRGIVDATWDREDPRCWGYALMDYGAHLKRTLPNPSRRSRYHARQSRFEGSHRQKRAAMLRAVLAEPGLDSETYADRAGVPAAAAEDLLRELSREGFVTPVGDVWRVPD